MIKRRIFRSVLFFLVFILISTGCQQQADKDEIFTSSQESQAENSKINKTENDTEETSEDMILKSKTEIVDVYQPYTSQRLYQDINSLCQMYPDLIRQFEIGTSAKGKKISCITLGNGLKKGCIIAGIHSREHITISFTMKCIEDYAKAYIQNKKYGEYDIRQLLKEYTLYIVPMCNPDGTDISTINEQPLISLGNFDHDSYKLNANGVNLNRNFPYHWAAQYGNQRTKAGQETYAGASAGSEKETQAIIRLCDENDFRWLLDMHILGNGIFWRDSGNKEINGDIKLTSALAKRCNYQVFPLTKTSADYSGGLENWFRYTYKKPALCIEMINSYQAYRVDEYYAYNSMFYSAVTWNKTKYTYLEAMVSG